jgi:hypothetical protein
MPKYDPKFAGYATRIAFDLRLTRPQIFYLCAIEALQHRPASIEDPENIYAQARHARWAEGGHDVWVPQAVKLGERGLVEHSKEAFSRGVHYRLTEAGQHVFALLKIAGLAVTFDTAANDEKPRVRVRAAR